MIKLKIIRHPTGRFAIMKTKYDEQEREKGACGIIIPLKPRRGEHE